MFGIEIERIQFEQVSNSNVKFDQKCITWESIIYIFIWFFDKNQSEKMVCCCHFETIKDHRSNV